MGRPLEQPRCSRSLRGGADVEAVEYRERPPNHVGLDSFHDEYQPRSVILARPAAQMGRRVHQMLHPVNGDGPLFARERQYSFDPQDSLAMPVEQHGQPDAEGRPVEGSSTVIEKAPTPRCAAIPTAD